MKKLKFKWLVESAGAILQLMNLMHFIELCQSFLV